MKLTDGQRAALAKIANGETTGVQFRTAIALRDLGLVTVVGGMSEHTVRRPGIGFITRSYYDWTAKITDLGRIVIG